jgi:hypothetical protein
MREGHAQTDKTHGSYSFYIFNENQTLSFRFSRFQKIRFKCGGPRLSGISKSSLFVFKLEMVAERGTLNTMIQILIWRLFYFPYNRYFYSFP